MIKTFTALALLLAAGACASSAPYGPADKSGAQGYAEQPIESNRYRVSYTDNSPEAARTRALRRAAEITKQNGAEWFQVVTAYDDASSRSRGGGSSVSVGGSSGSYGSGVGVGIGIGLPLGGGSSQRITHVLEIITGSGEKPVGADVYDADAVLTNLSPA